MSTSEIARNAHEALMAALARTPRPPIQTVTMSRNAKGDVQWEVACSGEDVFKCEQEAAEIHDRMTRRYPHSSLTDDLKPMLQATVAEQNADPGKVAAKAAAIARKMTG